MASSLSVVDPTSFGHLFFRTFLHHRPFHTDTSVVFFHYFLSSSSTTTMNTKKNTVSTSSQTTKTVANPYIISLKAAIFKRLALKLATELNTGTVSSTTRRAFFKILYNTSSQARRYRLNSITAYIFQAQKKPSVKSRPPMFLPSIELLLSNAIFVFCTLYRKHSMLSTMSFRNLVFLKHLNTTTLKNILLTGRLLIHLRR